MRFRPSLPRRLSGRAAGVPFVAFAVLATFACSLDKLTPPQAGQSATLNATVTGDTTVALGGTMTASVKTPDGPLPTQGVVVAWSTSDAAVATVNPTTGVVTAVGLGTAKISAKVIAQEVGEVSATGLQIRVRYAGIKITAIDSLIALNMTKVITVRGTNAAGVLQAPIPFSTAMQVVSRDVNVFEVNSTGALVAKANGTSRVFVQFDNLKDSTTVKVRQVTRSISFPDAVSNELAIASLNKDRALRILAKDSLNNDIAAPTITWGTSDATTVSINASTGVARGLKLGTSTITVSADGLGSSILARVTQVPATLTKVSGDALSALAGTATASPPRVTVLDSGNTIIPGVTVTFAVATGGGSVVGGTQTSAVGTGQAAATSWTLGTTAGTNTLTATSGIATTTFTATGTPGTPTKLIFSTQPAGGQAGQALPTVRVAVADAYDNVVTTATNAITISLASGPGTLGGTLTATAVSGVASFSNLTLSAIGSYTLTAAATGLTSATSNSFAMFGAATKLTFTTQPTGGVAGQPLTTFKVSVQDAAGNTVTSATNNVTIALQGGGTGLGGTLTVAAVAGVATFSAATLATAGTYTLTAAATGLTSATSSSFVVTAVGPPAKLAFIVQPVNTVAGATITPSVQVEVQDAAGVRNTSSTIAVTLGIETNVGSSTLSGVVTVNAVAGVATFPGMSLNKAGVGYKLNATSGTLTKAVSSTFNITAGAASKLAFGANIPNAVVGTAIAPPITVQVQDANGNLVSGSTVQISLSLTGGTAGAVLTGGNAVAAIGGIATFSGVSINVAGSNYQLVAQSAPLTNGPSSAFNVVAANSAIKLAFTTQPTNGTSGSAIAPPVQVAVQDNSGATVSSSTASITLSIASGPNGATLTNATANAVGGVATFTTLQVPMVGTGYTLSASATGLNPATSASFSIAPGTANKLAFIVQPVSSTAGVPFTNDLQVAVQDVNGNVVPTATNSITLTYGSNPGGGAAATTIKGTVTASAVNGIATFPGVRLTKTGSGYTLLATSSGLSTGSSGAFDITAGPAVRLFFKQQPFGVTAGASQTPAIQVAVVDSLDNTITTATNSITLALSVLPTGGTITGTVTQPAVAGVATFADIAFPKSGNHQLSASATDLTTTTSNTFFISAGAAVKLAFSVQPTATFVNAPMNPGTNAVQIQVQDALGNAVSSGASANTAITIALGNNPTGATISGTLTPNASFGSVSVPNDVKISKAGTGFTLTASASGLTTATSTPFDVGAFSTANKLVWLQQPTTNVTAFPFRTPISLAIADQYGNTVTTAPATTMTIGCAQSCSQLNTTATTSAGVATFTNYAITSAGTYNLFANTGSLFVENSASFVVALNTVITTGVANTGVYDVAVNGGVAYYIERAAGTGAIKSVNLTSGATATLASSLNNPAALVTDGTNVFWIEDATGLVKRVPVAGGAVVTMSTVMTGMQQVLQTDGTSLFFVANNAANTQREIKQLAKTAAAGTTPTTFYTATCGVVASCQPTFTISGTTMYYWRSAEAGIYSVPSAGGVNSTSLVTAVAQPGTIAVSASTIFYTSGTTLLTAPIAGGAATSRGAQFTSAATILAVDGSNLYSLDPGNSTLRKYSTSDFSFITLTSATAGVNTRALAFDALFAFWGDNGATTSLRRVAK